MKYTFAIISLSDFKLRVMTPLFNSGLQITSVYPHLNSCS